LAALRAPSGTGIKALAHITGGGFIDNIPRVLPKGFGVELDLAKIAPPPVFGWLARTGGVAEGEMLRTFNCGIGMVIAVEADKAAEIAAGLRASGEIISEVGRIILADKEPLVRPKGKLTL
ncbi:MAG TPA: AIR synthase-related protein, partial [Rhabdaerophilum sp.]|nr:AIR synthase-related protein [Rhabdaerophilum sp.]